MSLVTEQLRKAPVPVLVRSCHGPHTRHFNRNSHAHACYVMLAVGLPSLDYTLYISG